MQIIHLNANSFSMFPRVAMVQNDTGRDLKMVLDDMTLSGSETGAVAIHRSDGSYYTIPATRVIGDNAFTADMSQALTQPGQTECQLKVTASDDTVISTYTFMIYVQQSTDGLSTEQLGVSPEELIEAAQQLTLSDNDVKLALLQIAEKVAYIDENGQTYYDALEDALYPPVRATSVSLDKNSLVFSELNATQTLTATIFPSGVEDDTVYWGSSDTSVAVVYNGIVTSVGDGTAIITATCGLASASATVSVSSAGIILVGVSATYTQSDFVFTDTDLDNLKADLVVLAVYDDSSTAAVSADEYTLSGTLSEGASTITVTYGGFSDDFSVTASTRVWIYKNGDECTDVTGGWESTKGFNTGSGNYAYSDTVSLFLTHPASGTASWACSYNTVNTIDLDDYAYLCIDLERFRANTTSGTSSTTGNFWAYFPQTIANSTTQAGAYGSDYASRRSAFASSSYGNYYDGVRTVAIPSGMGSSYISFNANYYTRYATGNYTRIRSAYLIKA